MISYDEAFAIIMDNICIGKKTQLPLVECLGKVAAHAVFAPRNVPSFANSAMDGFAVRAADLEQATPAHPVRLPIIDTIGAGDNIAQIAAVGVAHIMTKC
ncbi:MAG: molybdopterin molybdotransferase [Hyphomonadaceae bacterium]|nr:MAG: molybdopterin molybdotransferase [Hyphomonadaceae bacterium]